MKTLRKILAGTGSKNVVQQSHSCCGGSGHTHHEGGSSQSKTAYQCSMKCEGDKTYNAPGNCPVCNMKLLQVG